jgi:hypothetical protein
MLKIIIEDNQVKKESFPDFVTKNAVDAGPVSRSDLITDMRKLTKKSEQGFKSSLVAIDAGPPSTSLIKNIQALEKSMKGILNENNLDAGAAPDL